MANADEYRIHFSAQPVAETQSTPSATVTGTTWVHRGLEDGVAMYYSVVAVGPAGSSPPSSWVYATPKGEWVLEQFGSRRFDDVLTGEKLSVPIAERQHVVLFAEGYQAQDLGAFHGEDPESTERNNDVDRWIDEVFSTQPYDLFREAFVIWYLARPSAEHLPSTDTAFKVPVNGGNFMSTGNISSQGETAALTWSALAAHPFAPSDFSGGGLGTARNFTAAFLLYDPGRGRASVSGRALGLRNPENGAQRLASGFGVGHAHEFTHAFSAVRDEYMEDDFAGRTWRNTPVSNVVSTRTCGELPWQHLLAGGGLHDQEELVGAFGRPELGFHAELLCLMNGTHENGSYYSRSDDGACRATSCTLRSEGRRCNHCREITAYQIFMRSKVIDEHEPWAQDYRPRFYERFGVAIPDQVPQSNHRRNPANGTLIYEGCVDTDLAAEDISFERFAQEAEATGDRYHGCVLVDDAEF